MSLLLFAVDSIRLPSRFSTKIPSANVQLDLNNIYAVKTRYIVKKRHDAEFAIEVSYVDRENWRGPIAMQLGSRLPTFVCRLVITQPADKKA